MGKGKERKGEKGKRQRGKGNGLLATLRCLFFQHNSFSNFSSLRQQKRDNFVRCTKEEFVTHNYIGRGSFTFLVAQLAKSTD